MLTGNDINEKKLEKFLKEGKYKFEKYKNIQKKIADLLSKNQIVIRVNGKMEFGHAHLETKYII